MELLQKCGYDVPDPVRSGEEAIDSVKASPPDLILMNINLTGKITGIEAARRIRKSAGIPIIFLTAHTRTDLNDLVKEVPRSGFIMKPFSDDDICLAIEMALKQ